MVLKVANFIDQELEGFDLGVRYKINDINRDINSFIKDNGKTYLCSNTELYDFRQESRQKWSEGN